MAVVTVHNVPTSSRLVDLKSNGSTVKLLTGSISRRAAASSASIRCCVASDQEARRLVTVKNGSDSLEICRILNGLWQTSGGWGRIDRDDAVEAMLRHADAGLSTFDMADHCTYR